VPHSPLIGLDISLWEYDPIAYLLIWNKIAITLGQKSLPR
jgi:hypothetical protein